MSIENIKVINLHRASGEQLFSNNSIEMKKCNTKVDISLHYHTCYEVEILLSGSAQIKVNNNSYEAKRGSFWISLPNDIHQINIHSDSVVILTAKFDDTVLSKKLHSIMNTLHTNIFGAIEEERIEKFEDSLESLLKIYSDINSTSSRDIFSKSILEMILSYLTDILLTHEVSSINLKKYSKIFEAVEIIKTHFREPLTVESVCKEIEYTPNYFSAKFKQVTGKSFVEFLNSYRFRFAYYLLTTTDYSVNDIAIYVGFQSVFYFSKAFKAHFGMSPSKVRKNVE